MVSAINPTLPVYGAPTTQSVRDNFQHAHDEITALQAATTGSPFLPIIGGAVTGPTSFAASVAIGIPAPVGTELLNVHGNAVVSGNVITSNINAPAVAPGSGLSGNTVTITSGARDGTSGSDGGIVFANGGTTGGNTSSLTHFSVGSFAGGRFLSVIGPSGASRQLRFQTTVDALTTSPRWQLTANATAEGGSNAGSDLDIINLSDAGTIMSNPLVRFTRATGVAAFAAPVSAPFHATGAGNIAMTGTTQATAKAVTTGLGIITSGLSLSNNGVVLPAIGAVTVVGAVPVGTKVDIFNTMTFAAHIYANGTQTIDGAIATTGVTLSAAARCSYFANSTSTWVSALMGGVSA
jgi:hypothetical protein